MKPQRQGARRIRCDVRTAAIKSLVVTAMLAALGWTNPSAAQAQAGERSSRAPELEGGREWLNADRPLRIHEELKGQVVLLDFWTYCCINCMHVLPDLAYLEKKYKDEPFIVIGVHSAKFQNEAEAKNIRSAILRYEIKHPVIVDDNMAIWRRYGVRSWPTLVVVDPAGQVVGSIPGEGHRALLDNVVQRILDEHRAKGTLAKAPLRLIRERLAPPESGLRFPGKVLADADNKRLIISDSNHNRIVIATWPGPDGGAKLIRTIGNGQVGRTNGPPEKARFNHPQGMALDGNTLFVADTENHLIRRVSLTTGRVRTLAGTGKQSGDRAGGKRGRRQGLNSPWDLEVNKQWLYIAMAGPHQLWRIDRRSNRCEAFVGSGRENILDGSMANAQLAQPSGLALAGNQLYFADSEVSAIRVADLEAGQVRTLIGKGLFDFADVDGTYPSARLQHCLGVTLWGDKLLVADTYNHKIKIIDPVKRASTTLLGTGKAGLGTPGATLELYEPGGLDFAAGVLFVADTNNHRIVRIDPETKQWAVVTIEGLTAPPVDDPE